MSLVWKIDGVVIMVLQTMGTVGFSVRIDKTHGQLCETLHHFVNLKIKINLLLEFKENFN